MSIPEPKHIRSTCFCGGRLIPNPLPNADPDEWVCSQGCEGLYFDWCLEEFIAVLGKEEGTKSFEVSRKGETAIYRQPPVDLPLPRAARDPEPLDLEDELALIQLRVEFLEQDIQELWKKVKK